MSTQFRASSTEEWVCTRYCGPALTEAELIAGKSRARFDFGARKFNAIEVVLAANAGESFYGDNGEHHTGEEFLKLLAVSDWTFGVFGGSMALGTGDVARFSGV